MATEIYHVNEPNLNLFCKIINTSNIHVNSIHVYLYVGISNNFSFRSFDECEARLHQKKVM